ncbi:MAG: DUF2341 domain-containing protein, partial [Oleispira sp.]|nr:DUF2341 domain-containing protein [Oleispira sp.]
ALAAVDAATGSSNSITAAQLNAIDGVNGAIVGNQAAYQAAIENGSAGDFDTVSEINAVIAAVNTIAANDAALTELAEDIAGNANSTLITAAQLNAITGVTGVNASDIADYNAALIAATYEDSANPTVAEINAVIAAVNASIAALTKINNAATAGDASSITIADIASIEGMPELDTELLADYQVAIAAASGAETNSSVEIVILIENIADMTPSIRSIEAVDLDDDGYTDAVHITFSKVIDDNTVKTSDWDVEGVSGESFSSTTNGDSANDQYIYITFEDGVLDNGATPKVTFTEGNLASLSGQVVHKDIFNIVTLAGNDDAATGIDPLSITYTHAVDFRGAATSQTPANINGLAFTDGLNTSSQTDINSGKGFGLAGPSSEYDNNTAAAENSGLRDLFKEFYYAGGASHTLTLSGLTGGESYKVRFFVAGWTSNRVIFTSDNNAFNAGSLDRGTSGANIVNAIEYTFTQGASDTDIKITFAPTTGGFHWYGFTNEVYEIQASADQALAASATALAKIQAAVGGDASGITVNDLNDVFGVNGAIVGNQAAYQAAIANGSAGDFDTVSEILDMVNSVNALAKGVTYENNWTHSQDLTINTTSSGADVSDDVSKFPLLIRLNSTNFDFSEAQTNGEDIRFASSDGFAFDYEIERWDSVNKLAEIWVQVDRVRGDNSTQFIVMYWGNSGVSSESNSAAVFDTANGFAGVWHLGEDGNTTANGYADATSNSNDGQGANLTSSSDVNGVIGRSQNFDGTADYIEVDYSATLNTPLLTVGVWARIDGGAGNRSPIAAMGNSHTGYLSGYLLYAAGDDTWQGWSGNGSKWGNVSLGSELTSVWTYVVMTYDGSTQKLYLDGEQVDTSPSDTLLAKNESFPLRIGAGETEATAGYFFNGPVDEARVSNTNRSADWIKLSYENQKSDQTLVFFNKIEAAAIGGDASAITVDDINEVDGVSGAMPANLADYQAAIEAADV